MLLNSLFIPDCGILISKLLKQFPFSLIGKGGQSKDSDLKKLTVTSSHFNGGAKQQHLALTDSNNLGQWNQILFYACVKRLQKPDCRVKERNAKSTSHSKMDRVNGILSLTPCLPALIISQHKVQECIILWCKNMQLFSSFPLPQPPQQNCTVKDIQKNTASVFLSYTAPYYLQTLVNVLRKTDSNWCHCLLLLLSIL